MAVQQGGAESRLPLELWSRIASLLQPSAKACLAATCRTLRAASVDWFHHDVITVGWSALGPDGLTWLCRVQATVNLRLALRDWPALGAVGASDVRLARISLAVPPRWRLLPAKLASLAQLVKLRLSHDRPARGWQLLPGQLQHLDLSNCLMWGVPAELTALTRLSSLSLANTWVGCDWQHLPRQLQQLDLSGCHLKVVPAVLAALTQLTKLSVSCNEHWGVGLEDLPGQLWHLEVTRSFVSGRLDRLAHLTGLTELRPDSNPFYPHVWDPLEQLQQLQRLHLRRCRVRQVPAVFRSLTQLTSLSLAGNPIKGGWQNLPAQLQQLDLEWCGLRRVPAELAGLTHLQKLRLDLNHITGGWQHLPPQLQHLMPCHGGRSWQLPRVLSPVLSPSFWVPVIEYLIVIVVLAGWFAFYFSLAYEQWLIKQSRNSV